ncbi:MAG: hypothetical protein KIT60_30075 [Burkholderiaceae bacterium]|nr:hypothetical protein [Burkholderiaceae bacterium]
MARASGTTTLIAQHAAAPVIDYNDSFAFVPGISSGNMRVTAVVYRASGYSPSANHEIEIILGCRTTAGGNHRWIECLWSAQGAADIVDLDGGPSGFTVIGVNTGQVAGPRDGDVWVAELHRAANTVRWWVNGTLACTAVHPLISNLGDGAGIAAFMRPGDTDPGALGFRSVRCEAI